MVNLGNLKPGQRIRIGGRRARVCRCEPAPVVAGPAPFGRTFLTVRFADNGERRTFDVTGR
jgi:hypothetical protein